MFTRRLLRVVCTGCHPGLRLAAGSRCPSHVVSSLGGGRLHVPGVRTLWSGTPCRNARLTGGGGDFGDHSSDEEDDEEEDLGELLIAQTLDLYGDHCIFIIHPDVKWGAKKPRDSTAELLVAEAVALVESIPNWMVLDKLIMSTKSPDSKLIFGKGNFQKLTEMIRAFHQITAVFVNVEKLSPSCEKELEAAWRVKVFDRYSVVLNIFRCNAHTKEAKLQIALAELPLLRSKLRNEMAHLDQQGGGSRYVMGSGETLMQIQQRLLKEKELKLQKALEKLRKRRKLLRSQRKRRGFPVISVMGYTNCGKTTLIKALTGDTGLFPRDQLFATLDITAHGGFLPCRMPVLYVDTIGFLSQLPHRLIESFSATLEDVIHSDLLIHVRDISHPEAVNQKKSVLSALANLNVPQKLLDTMIEVHNKIDLVELQETDDAAAFPVSALLGYGLEDLKQRIETRVMENTGRIAATIRINLESLQLSWLYKEASVQEVKVLPEAGEADVLVFITNAAYGKYKKLFCK